MPTSSGGLRYPASTDAVNVPGDMQKLAEDVDTYKAPKASPTFSGTVTTALTTAGYVKTSAGGVLSSSAAVPQADVTNLTTDLAAKAPAANPTFTGVASFPDGSASAPSITNTGDTNTGLFHPADDTVAISTAGVERLRVNSSGDVELGGTGTGAKLHLYRISATNTAYLTTDGGGAVNIFTGTTSPAARVVIDAAGNVGVGSTSPNTNLHINSNSSSSLRVQRNSTDATSATISFVKQRGTNASPTVVSSGDVLGDLVWFGYDGGALRNAAMLRASVDATPGASDMPGNLSFWTVPDGSTALTERMKVDSNGLITGTGTSLGAWTAYTPTLGGTGWAIGNGTITAAYCQIGKTVHFRNYIAFGSTSTFGASGLTLTFPVTAQAGQGGPVFIGRANDVSAGAEYPAFAVLTNTSTMTLRTFPTTAGNASVEFTTSAPFTWASGDILMINGTYQAA